MEESEFCPTIVAVRKEFFPGFMEVVSVNGKIGDAGGNAMIKDMGDEWAISEGDEWLWEGFSEGL